MTLHHVAFDLDGISQLMLSVGRCLKGLAGSSALRGLSIPAVPLAASTAACQPAGDATRAPSAVSGSNSGLICVLLRLHQVGDVPGGLTGRRRSRAPRRSQCGDTWTVNPSRAWPLVRRLLNA